MSRKLVVVVVALAIGCMLLTACKKKDKTWIPPVLTVIVLDDFTGAAVSGATVTADSLTPVDTNSSGVAAFSVGTADVITVVKTGYETITVTDFAGPYPTIKIRKMFGWPGSTVTVSISITGFDEGAGDTGGMLMATNGMSPVGFDQFTISGTSTVPSPILFEVPPDIPFALSVMGSAATPMAKYGYHLEQTGFPDSTGSIDITVTAVNFGDPSEVALLTGNQEIPVFTGYTPASNDMMIFAKTPQGALLVGGGDWDIGDGSYDGGAMYIPEATSYHLLFDLSDETAEIDVMGLWHGTFNTISSVGTDPVQFLDVVALTAPLDAATVDATATLTWVADPDADLYLVEVENSTMYTAFILGTGTSFAIPAAWNLSSGTYTWWVTALELNITNLTTFSGNVIQENTLRATSSFPRTFDIP